MSPYSRAQLENVASGSGLASGMLPMGKRGLGPGGRFMLLRGKTAVNPVVYREPRMDRNLVLRARLRVSVAVFFLTSVALISATLVSTATAFAETGADAWLRYAPLREVAPSLPSNAVVVGDSDVARTAGSELLRALDKTRKQVLAGKVPKADAFVLGTWKDIHPLFPELKSTSVPSGDGFWLKTVRHHGHSYWLMVGANDRGVLYGTFSLLSRIAQQQDVQTLDDSQSPSAPIRWVTQWDNLDGSIERGYAGRSIFFDNGQVRGNLSRVSDYARLLASVGINGC